MIVTVSKLRANIYTMLDRVLETGIAVEINRKGRILKIIPTEAPSKFSNLKKHDALLVDFDDIVHMDWSDQWKS